MKLLLDTHIFLWFISGDKRLPAFVQTSIRNSENEVYLSVASVWEALVKYQLGKLSLPDSPEKYLPLQRKRHGIDSLPISEACVTQLAKLPKIHRDPFDRILISQALEYGLTMVTIDEIIFDYPVIILNQL